MLGAVLIGLLGVAVVVSIIDDDDDDDGVEEVSTQGTDGDDSLTGGSGKDNIFAAEGDDLVRAGAGDDFVFGGAGDDLIAGEAGDDVLFGRAGDDLVFAGEGEDSMRGDGGDDILFGTDVVDAIGLLDAFETSLRMGTPLSEEDLASFVDFDADQGEADTLMGGAGDDETFAGNNDLVIEERGMDTVNFGDWIDTSDPDTTPLIDGFNPAQDSIVYFYEGEEPTSFSFSEEDDGGNLLVDGEVVARFINTNFDALATETVTFLSFT